MRTTRRFDDDDCVGERLRIKPLRRFVCRGHWYGPASSQAGGGTLHKFLRYVALLKYNDRPAALDALTEMIFVGTGGTGGRVKFLLTA